MWAGMRKAIILLLAGQFAKAMVECVAADKGIAP